MGTEAAATTLTVYSRTYCHLCDDMIAGLHAVQARFRFDLDIVDVDSDDALEARDAARQTASGPVELPAEDRKRVLVEAVMEEADMARLLGEVQQPFARATHQRRTDRGKSSAADGAALGLGGRGSVVCSR